MKRDKHETETVFRKFPEGDILALFPYMIETLNYDVGCYQHIGQHGTADYNHCIEMTKPAKPKEYSDLLKELESMGYNIKPIQRINGREFSKAIDNFNQQMR